MAADAELTRLIAEKVRVQASIDQIEADNTVQGSFGDVSIRRNEIKDLEDQRARVNVRIQRRKGQLLGLRDPVWGSVVRATRRPPDGIDLLVGDYETDETDLGPSDMSGGGGETPAQTYRIYGWVAPNRNTAQAIPVGAFFTDTLSITFPSHNPDGFPVFAQEAGAPDFTSITEPGQPFGFQLYQFELFEDAFTDDGALYDYWIFPLEQVGSSLNDAIVEFAR